MSLGEWVSALCTIVVYSFSGAVWHWRRRQCVLWKRRELSHSDKSSHARRVAPLATTLCDPEVPHGRHVTALAVLTEKWRQEIKLESVEGRGWGTKMWKKLYPLNFTAIFHKYYVMCTIYHFIFRFTFSACVLKVKNRTGDIINALKTKSNVNYI